MKTQTMQTLYQIETQYLEIIERLEASLENDSLTPEDIDALNADLELNSEEFKAKADAYTAVIEAKMAEADRLKAKAKRFAEQAKQEEVVADRLKARISAAMTQFGMGKVVLENATLNTRKSYAVEISVKPEELPALFQRTKLVYEADKDAIKKEIQMGGTVPGAALVERVSLQIC